MRGQEQSVEEFFTNSLIPYNQALLFRYAIGDVKEETRETHLKLLEKTIRAYKRGGFLPLVDEDYIDRLERHVKRYLEQPGLQTRFSPELCRMVAILHLPGVVHFAEPKLLEAFGAKVAAV